MDAARFSSVPIGTKTFFCFRSILHAILKVMSHTAHRSSCCRLPDAAAPQNTSRAEVQRTSSLLIPCAHRKLNVKHHQTAPKPEIRTVPGIHIIYIIYHGREIKRCAGEKIEHQNEYLQATQQQQCGYACIQARLISRNPGSTEEACEYGLSRGTCFAARSLELVAVAGRLWISWCVLGWEDF